MQYALILNEYHLLNSCMPSQKRTDIYITWKP